MRLRSLIVGPPRSFIDMLDVLFIVGGLAFFAISLGYTLVCERL